MRRAAALARRTTITSPDARVMAPPAQRCAPPVRSRCMIRPLRPHLAAHAATSALALLLVSSACRKSDDAGAGAQQRVVSVSKQINEFMYAIGAEDAIVARDLTSTYPPAIQQKPSVGYHRALSAEGITSARPTLVLTDGNVGPEPVLAQLRTVGIPILTLAPGSSVDSAQLLLTRLGREFHRERAADSVLAAWRAGMEQVRADSARWAGGPHPRVLIVHFGQLANDYLAVKRGGTADRLLAWAGGENAVDSTGGMARLTPELVARLAPDVIIATDVGFDRMGSAERFATLPGIALTPAARAGRIYRVDESEIMYFGPRTPASVRRIGGLLHADGTHADSTHT
jgi:iron complex transport system substrate-binding protein